MASGSFRFFQYQLPFRNPRRWLEVLDLTLALYQKLTTHMFLKNEKKTASINPPCRLIMYSSDCVRDMGSRMVRQKRTFGALWPYMWCSNGGKSKPWYAPPPPTRRGPTTWIVPGSEGLKWAHPSIHTLEGQNSASFANPHVLVFAGIHPRIFEIRCFLYISSPAAFRALMLYTSWFHYID